MLIFAPAASSICAFAFDCAICRGVKPLLFSALTFAPLAISNLTISGDRAKNRGVVPLLLSGKDFRNLAVHIEFDTQST